MSQNTGFLIYKKHMIGYKLYKVYSQTVAFSFCKINVLTYCFVSLLLVIRYTWGIKHGIEGWNGFR